jgi:predicted Zn-dependent protease with MMP-like domain
MPQRLSERQFRALVGEALDGLPQRWAELLDQVIVLVEDMASPDDLADAGFEPDDAADLLGLYVGIPITERGAFDEGLPDRVMIYRLPILDVCATRADVVREVQHTVLHELGHHFGLAEDDLPF